MWGFSETLLAQFDTSKLSCGLNGNGIERLKITSRFVGSDERFCLYVPAFRIFFSYSFSSAFHFLFCSVFWLAFYCNSFSSAGGTLFPFYSSKEMSIFPLQYLLLINIAQLQYRFAFQECSKVLHILCYDRTRKQFTLVFFYLGGRNSDLWG